MEHLVKKIPLRFAINATLSLLSAVITFHILVLIGIIPYAIVWGGRIQNETQLRDFEVVSIVINVFVIFIILIKAKYMNLNVPVNLLNGMLWILIFIFAVNTVGNLFAESAMETIIFTPITFILAILCFRIVKG